jgi:hypothetical protein
MPEPKEHPTPVAPQFSPEQARLDERLDEALQESFPASDPPAAHATEVPGANRFRRN